MNDLMSFIEVFGCRFPGLHDPGSQQYQIYRVPNPEAPYPQDYIIDQEGKVAFWSEEYDPQEIISVIDRLLGPLNSIDDLTIMLSDNEIFLEWGTVARADSYQIYSSSEPWFTVGGDPLAVVSAPDTSWSANISLFQGNSHFFKVIASTGD